MMWIVLSAIYSFSLYFLFMIHQTSSENPGYGEEVGDLNLGRDTPVFILMCLVVILVESLLIIYSIKKLQKANKIYQIRS